MGVEVNTVARLVARRGARALARRLREHARPRARRLLPHAGRACRSSCPIELRRDPAPDRHRARADAASSTCSTTARTWIRAARARATPCRSPTTMAEHRRRVPREAARRRRRDRRGADGVPTSAARSSTRPRSRRRSRRAVTNDELYPVTCGVATKNLGTHSLLDLLVEGDPVAGAQGDRRSTRTAAPPRSSSRPSPTRSPGGSRSSASTAAPSPPTRRSSTCATRRRSGSAA